MKKNLFSIIAICLCLTACSTHRQLPPFANQHWHVDASTGNAVSTSGVELAFGSRWMVTDTTLMQTVEQVEAFQKLPSHLAAGIYQFPEIAVDSILYYNPHRGLLFVAYHQVRPLKPTSEISLYPDTDGLYSKEYARIFGNYTTFIDDTGWEDGPMDSVYSNVSYKPNKKRLVHLLRLPGHTDNIAVIQIWATKAKRGRWWEDYPLGTFWNIDLGDPDNIESISSAFHYSRTMAVDNLKLIFQKLK